MIPVYSIFACFLKIPSQTLKKGFSHSGLSEFLYINLYLFIFRWQIVCKYLCLEKFRTCLRRSNLHKTQQSDDFGFKIVLNCFVTNGKGEFLFNYFFLEEKIGLINQIKIFLTCFMIYCNITGWLPDLDTVQFQLQQKLNCSWQLCVYFGNRLLM